VLERGYGVPLGADGRVLRGIEAFRLREGFALRVKDGRVEATVTRIEEIPAAAPVWHRSEEDAR
jgi:exonuclease VII large subunit